MTNFVYLDCNATTPLSKEVIEFAQSQISEFGNPSSIHSFGRGPKTRLRDARTMVAKMIYADPLEIIFTSGGSESNNLALKGVSQPHRNRILISSVEHPSVLKTAMSLKNHHIDLMPVNRQGEVDLEIFSNLVTDKTALVSFMFANNETGHIFPIEQMTKIAHDKGALFHTDAVQALGKIEIDVRKLNVDFLSLSAHKFYGLKGAGVLYARKGVELQTLIHGGGQERSRRAGTENILSVAALGVMCAKQDQVVAKNLEIKNLRDQMESQILERIPAVRIVGQETDRLPNTSCLIIDDVDGEILLMNLDIEGYAVSTGAACSSGSPDPSPVLLAMGYLRREAQHSLRISLGWHNTQDEIIGFVEALKKSVERIRSFKKVGLNL